MKRRITLFVSILLTASLTFGASYLTKVSAATIPGINSLVSYNSSNTGQSTGGGFPSSASIADDGGTVVTYSSDTNVVSGVTTGNHLYSRNLSTNTSTLIDVDLNGNPAYVEGSGGNGGNYSASSNSRYIAYVSKSTNVVSSPTVPSGNLGNIYLKDTLLGTTTLVNTTSSGALANNGGNTGTPAVTGVSDDGRFVSFVSQSSNLLASNNPTSPNYTNYPYIKDMVSGQVINPASSNGITRANSYVGPMVMSCNGSEIIFYSNATNLTPQDDGQYNVYSLDLRNGYHLTNLTYAANADVSMGGGGVSCNGRYILVYSSATNLTSDSVTGSIYHIFRFDRFTSSYSLVDKSTSGYIPSTSTADYIPGGTVYGSSRSVSDNGLVVFYDDDHNLVSPAASRNHEVYLRDPSAGTTSLVPVNSSGVEQNAVGAVNTLAITGDGKSILYNSKATNLVPGITSAPGSSGYTVLSKTQ